MSNLTSRRRRRSIEDRFWEKVIKTESCWIWNASINGNGYGSFGMHGKVLPSHRVAWILTNGEIADGLLICHTCDNRACVNPSHLFLGTNAENMADMSRKCRRQSLSNEQIARIRLLLKSDEMTQAEIAKSFGVSKALITGIKKGYLYAGKGEL